MFRRFLSITCLLVGALTSSLAFAQQEARQPAREAYARGDEQARAGNFAEAARSFAEADALAPNPIALEAALEAAIRADDAVLAMGLVSRASRSPEDAKLPAVERAEALFRPRVAKLAIACMGAQPPCRARIDDQPAAGTEHWVLPGRIEVSFGTGLSVFVAAVAGGVHQVSPPPPQAAKTTQPADRATNETGISAAWALLPGGIAVGLAAVTIASIVRTGELSDDLAAFQQDQRPAPGAGASAGQAYENGQRELIDEGETWATVGQVTGGLAGAAAGAAIVVVVVSLVTGSEAEAPAAYVVPLEGGGVAGVAIRF